METLLVKAANGGKRLWRRVQVSWSIIQRRCWYRCATLATKYFGSYVKGVEDMMFWRNLVRGVRVSRTRKEANSGIPNYLQAACCKSCTSAAGEGSFSSVRCLKTWLWSRMGDERFSNLEVLSGHRSLFPVMRTIWENSALRTTSKRSNLRKVYLTYWLYWRRLCYICWGCK